MLTVKKIEALVKSGAVREEPDGSVRGVYFLPPSKAWLLRYRHRRRPRKYTIGHWPEVGIPLARKIATELWGEIVQGRDPAAEKQAAKAAAQLAVELFAK